MTDLDTLAGDSFSDAHWINDNGQVVGLSCDTNGNCRAFLWQNGVMTDINELTQAGSPLYALEALEINTRGEIVGYGLQLSTGEIHAFLATPLAKDDGAAITLGVSNEVSHSVKKALPENARQLLQRRAIFGGGGRGATRNP
jgi:probable HAF family extracellular repeat protein